VAILRRGSAASGRADFFDRLLGVRSGRLITVEGLDGAGKTTLVAGVTRELAARGRELLVLREPGGVELSERIRVLVKDPKLTVDPRAEALLYAAARAQLVAEQLVPLLDGGQWVLLDRFVDSSLAYQGAGRELGIEQIRTLNAFATGGLTPDRTLLLRIDPAVGRARIAGREADRLELAGEVFFARVARAYDALAAAEPERIAVIEADRPPEQVLADALAALEPLLSSGA
jgi:dTMP kinase